jgi:Big-like domain-containing protein
MFRGPAVSMLGGTGQGGNSMKLRQRAWLTGIALIAASCAVGAADARAPRPAGTEVATVTVVSSSQSPALFGVPVTFTATVTTAVGGNPVDAGTVTFTRDGTIPLVTVDVGADGVAEHTAGTLAPGSHSITASYSGVQNRFEQSADSLTQQIDLRPTTTTLTASPGSPTLGQEVTFTASVVDAAGGIELNDGMVAFSINSVTVVTTPVSGGSASFSTSTLPIGGHGIRATYVPVVGGIHAGSEAEISLQVFQPATATSVTSSMNPSQFHRSVTFTATVTSDGNPVTSGSVAFSAGQLDLGTVAVDGNGQASVSTAALDIGQHQIFAIYLTNSSFSQSFATLDQTVTRLPTITALESSQNPAAVGEPVTFTARVFFNGTVPDGIVDFFDNGLAVGSVQLDSNGVASLATSELTVGEHRIVASYAGSATFAPSNSDELVEQIEGPGPTTTPPGGSTTSTTSTSSPPTTSSTAPPNPSTTTSEPSTSGPSTTQPAPTSTAPTVPTTSPTDGGRATNTVLATSANPSVEGEPVTFSVAVSSDGGGPIGLRSPSGSAPPVGGSVTITDDGTVLAVVALEEGRAAFTTSSLSAGTHTITAAFSGTAAAAPSSASIEQRVDPADELPATR